MQLTSTLALCAALLSAAVEGRIAFTTLPSTVKAGSPVKLSWEGSDGTPVTITLKRGDPNNLATVALITGNASGNSYTWSPSTDLPNGNDYALQISQDDTDTNYSGLITLTGGSSSSGSSSSGSGSATATATSSASASNTTVTTSKAPVGTAAPSGGVSGTGSITASRNTTLSRATLSRTSSSSSSEETATTTEGEGSSSETATSSPSPTGAAVTLASNLGLLVAGFVAVIYLG